MNKSWTDEEIEKLVVEVSAKLEEECRKAPKCFCGFRCDQPFGNGEECLVCASRPTAECMKMIVY